MLYCIEKVKKINIVERGSDHQLKLRIFHYETLGKLNFVDIDVFPVDESKQIPIETVGIKVS